MKNNKLIVLVLSIFLALNAFSVQASLFDRGRGLIYDDVLNITWLQDANYAMTSGYTIPNWNTTDGYSGTMNWFDAMTWVDQLEYGGYDDWRLPGYVHGKPGFGSVCMGTNCTDTELGYMFYNNMFDGRVRFITGTLPISSGYNKDNLNLFKNLKESRYWSNVQYYDEYFVLVFNNKFGYQSTAQTGGNGFYVWAVRDGDVAAVPIPATIWLFASGLGLLSFSRRKQNNML